MILHIFMYNVISDFSAATPASEGRVKATMKHYVGNVVPDNLYIHQLTSL